MIITRIPPSPTGKLHIGTARTALFNYLFAKKNGGKMVFRSEDTDKARSTKESEAEIMSGLQWLGITWDNEGEVVRLKNPNKSLTFNDLVRGDITFDTTELGDVVIARNLDDALYHFTVVVDDYLMGVTHVIRGEDHISNTPRQILIQEALGIERPIYAHLPLILAPDRSKMSKRHGAVSIESYRELGYTKDAILNYLALLGWNPGTDQELFTLAELVEKFEVNQIQKSGAVFDIKKFNWFNKEYLKRFSTDEFAAYLDLSNTADLPEYFDITSDSFTRLLPTIQERISIRQEAVDEIKAGEYDFVFVSPTEYAVDMLKWKNDPDASAALPRLEKAAELLASADFSTPDTIKTALWSYAEEVGKGELFSPLRIALSGKAQSPDPFTIAYIVGLEETLRRIKTACDKIKG